MPTTTVDRPACCGYRVAVPTLLSFKTGTFACFCFWLLGVLRSLYQAFVSTFLYSDALGGVVDLSHPQGYAQAGSCRWEILGNSVVRYRVPRYHTASPLLGVHLLIYTYNLVCLIGYPSGGAEASSPCRLGAGLASDLAQVLPVYSRP